MKLIDILVRELPKRGGWPDGGILAVQDCDKWICFSTSPEVEISGLGEWDDNDGGWVLCIKNYGHLADDYSKSIITREQYEAALAASKPEWDGEGLPPVGCECELSNAVEFYTHSGTTDFDEGTPVVVGGTVNFGLGDFVAVKVKGTNCITDINPCFLRPIRSEADKKRDEAETALRTCLAGTGAGITPLAAKCIYGAIAAGKIPHIRID